MKPDNIIYRFIALSLAVLIFITSVGLIIDVHYCGGKIKSFSLMGKAKSCHETTSIVCPHHQKMMKLSGKDQIDTKNCCSNKAFHFILERDLKNLSSDCVKETEAPSFIHDYCDSSLFINPGKEGQNIFSIYKPPIILRDIPVLIQSFLL